MPNQLALATWQFTSHTISSTLSPQKNRSINPDILKVYFYFN